VKCRPIAVTSVWRRLLSSITARQISEKLAPVLTGMKQFGVGMPAGVEHAAMEARLWHSLFGTTVQLDCVNAFNSVDRAAILAAIQRFCPELLPYFTAVYCGETLPEMRAEMRKADGAQADLVYLILSELGCQQGDPLGPLLFALALVHVLNPVSTDGAVDESGAPATTPLAQHIDYLDDMNVFLAEGFSESAAAVITTVQTALKSIGLVINFSKSLAVAKQGTAFDDAERTRLADLGLPFVDSSTPVTKRGFITMGIPVGSREFIRQVLNEKLFNGSLWQLSWHLIGMSERHLQAAMMVFRGAFTRRMTYIARNVDPAISAPWLAGFDGFCIWTLEMMLGIHGSMTVAAFAKHLQQACFNQDASAASGESVSQLAHLGPQGLLDLPLQMASLRTRAGGLGLPTLRRSCLAAFTAQLQSTLAPRLAAATASRARLTGGDRDAIPAGLASATVVQAYHSSLQQLVQSTKLEQKALSAQPAPQRIVLWARAEPDQDDTAAFAAIMSSPLQLKSVPARSGSAQVSDTGDVPTTTNSTPSVSRTGRSIADERKVQHRLQNSLQSLLNDSATEAFEARLQDAAEIHKWSRSGPATQQQHAARLSLAQWHSQCGRSAMDWLGYRGWKAEMSTLATASLMLMTMFIEPWRLTAVDCPYCAQHGVAADTTTVHALGCSNQDRFGANAVHLAVKRDTQHLIRSIGRVTGPITNEDTSMFSLPTARTQPLCQADTALRPGALSLCADRTWQNKGFVLDTTIAAPTAWSHLRQAATTVGAAAQAADSRKFDHHRGRLNEQRWCFVPMSMECFGRFGVRTSKFLHELSWHAAHVRGGAQADIKRRRGYIEAQLRGELSVSLAKANAERLVNYITGVVEYRGFISPVSALLNYHQ
jgi:hypothetical protein